MYIMNIHVSYWKSVPVRGFFHPESSAKSLQGSFLQFICQDQSSFNWMCLYVHRVLVVYFIFRQASFCDILCFKKGFFLFCGRIEKFPILPPPSLFSVYFFTVFFSLSTLCVRVSTLWQTQINSKSLCDGRFPEWDFKLPSVIYILVELILNLPLIAVTFWSIGVRVSLLIISKKRMYNDI